MALEQNAKIKKLHDEAECEKKQIVRGALLNLMNFKAESKAKICIHKYFGNELLTNNERFVITQAFKALDIEGDGTLGFKEIRDGI